MLLKSLKQSVTWQKRVPAPVNHDNTQGLRMPSMQLPSIRRDSVVQDDISEFLERFNQQTASHLPAGTRFSLLEQQCVCVVNS